MQYTGVSLIAEKICRNGSTKLFDTRVHCGNVNTRGVSEGKLCRRLTLVALESYQFLNDLVTDYSGQTWIDHLHYHIIVNTLRRLIYGLLLYLAINYDSLFSCIASFQTLSFPGFCCWCSGLDNERGFVLGCKLQSVGTERSHARKGLVVRPRDCGLTDRVGLIGYSE